MWILIIFIIFNIIAFIVPKRLDNIVIYATCLFGYIFGTTADLILSLHYDLYGYFQKGFQWVDLISVILYYPVISYLFLNFYPSEKSLYKKVAYIILWTIFAVAFEWLSVQTDFFYYNGWKLWYSVIMYPFIYLILVINMSLVQRINHSRK